MTTTIVIDKCGMLQKRGELNRAWRSRWCQLVGATLFYYKTQRDAAGGNIKAALDSIKLDQAVVRQATDDDGTPHCFEIVTKNRAFLLAAESRDSMHDWISALVSDRWFVGARSLTGRRRRRCIVCC